VSYDYHSGALTLTLLIMSESMQPRYRDALEHPAYEVLERACSGYTDEKKADLYARLAERVRGSEPMLVLQKAVSDCMFENDKEYPHG
jgi:hypothetical protein